MEKITIFFFFQLLSLSGTKTHQHKKTSMQSGEKFSLFIIQCTFVCVEVLQPSQPSGVMSSTVSLPNHTFTGQA